MLKSNRTKTFAPPPFGTQVNTSRDNINILDDIDEEGDQDDELTRAMEFVCLYELRKHQIGLSSILKPLGKERNENAIDGHRKIKGKVERPKEMTTRMVDKPNTSSNDTSFCSQQRKLNARPTRTSPNDYNGQYESKPNPEQTFGLTLQSNDQSKSRPCFVTDFFKDQLDSRTPIKSSPFEGELLKSSTVQINMPKWSDFQIELPKQPAQRQQQQEFQYQLPSFSSQLPMNSQFRAEQPAATWQSQPFQRVEEHQSPSFIRPVVFGPGQFSSPMMSSSSRYQQEFRQPAYEVPTSRYEPMDRHSPSPVVRRQLRYQDDDQFDEPRSLYESPSRPFIIPSSNKRAKQEKMVHAKSQREINQYQHTDPEPRGKAIAVLSVEHEFRVDKDGVRTSQQPMKHSESFYIVKKTSSGRQETTGMGNDMHQQSDPEDESQPSRNHMTPPQRFDDSHQHRPSDKPVMRAPPKQQSKKFEREAVKSPRTPIKNTPIKQQKSRKGSEREGVPSKQPADPPKKYFKEEFSDRLKSLIGSKTVNQIHVDVHNPISSTKARRQVEDNDNFDGALDKSLENLSRAREAQQYRDDSDMDD